MSERLPTLDKRSPPEASQGRPTVYRRDIADEIIDRLAEGETLRQICRDPRMPSAATVHGWVLNDRDGFAQRYARARALLLEHWAEDIIEIGDHTQLDPRDRHVKIEARKWLLSKLKPERYGNKVQHTGGDGDGPIRHAHGTIEFTIVDPEKRTGRRGED